MYPQFNLRRCNIKVGDGSRPYKGLCNNYLGGGGGGVGKLEGSIGENDNKRDGGLNVKFNTYRGGAALLFHPLLQTGNVVEELLEFKYKY